LLLICFSGKELNSLGDIIFKSFGFEEYIRYLTEQKGITIKKELRRILSDHPINDNNKRRNVYGQKRKNI
jgi:hypothetical protein